MNWSIPDRRLAPERDLSPGRGTGTREIPPPRCTCRRIARVPTEPIPSCTTRDVEQRFTAFRRGTRRRHSSGYVRRRHRVPHRGRPGYPRPQRRPHARRLLEVPGHNRLGCGGGGAPIRAITWANDEPGDPVLHEAAASGTDDRSVPRGGPMTGKANVAWTLARIARLPDAARPRTTAIAPDHEHRSAAQRGGRSSSLG